MGKKSKKGKSRSNQHHGKSKRKAETSNRDATTDNKAKTDAPPKDTTPAAPTLTPVPASAPAPEPPLVPEPKAKAVEEDSKPDLLPSGLSSNLSLLTPNQAKLAQDLCAAPTLQSHLFDSWSDSATTESQKLDLVRQLERMDAAYPSGGLVGYIRNARELLERSSTGVNPLEGWKPHVPQGEMLEIGTDKYEKFEQMGLEEIGKCGFVLVAGGLGERLGYGGIKLGLPIEMATEMTYLQYYIETILAIQARYSKNIKLPLCIMVSNDTNAGTLSLLEANDYYGMDKDQITFVQQGDGVPALKDNNATIAMDANDPTKIQAKPHGHGDIHALLHSHGVALNWCKKGLEWVIFYQDTNGLAFHALAAALGVSKSRDLVLNSIAVPRKAKQAIGGIAMLTNASGEERTINVEYNQLDPLLRASGFPDGDVNDEKTGFSPFPGNINQLLFKLKPYAEALVRTKGAMPEFVNPKYADEAKTTFKKPTRLECMMQDFPTILSGDASKRVGFTSLSAEMCFSPVKNATADGVKLQEKGTAPGVASTGEADQYTAVRKIMTAIGCSVEDAPEATFSGIKITPGPEIVTKASFTVCPAEYKCRFPEPSQIKISGRSSLVVEGNVVIESLDLDGALVIECEQGAPCSVIKDLTVKNKGWKKVADSAVSSPEYIRIRGYCLEKTETKKIVFKKDGSVEGYTPPAPKPVAKAPAKSPTKPVIEAPAKSLAKPTTEPSAKSAAKADSSPLKVQTRAPIDQTNVDVDLSRPNTPEISVKEAQHCCTIS